MNGETEKTENEISNATCYPHLVRSHQFVVDACGGDAELICVLQKVMEKFLNAEPEPLVENPAAVAEWFYAKYGKH